MSASRPAFPSEVTRLAERLGARPFDAPATVTIAQKGTLRTDPQAKWMRFTARQSIDAGQIEFAWNARTGPLGIVRVTDALAEGVPTGGVTLAGLFTLAAAEPTPDLLKGQLMRYLAELPWCPDAILSNPALAWSVESDHSIRVSAMLSEISGSVLFTLDDVGLPVKVTGMRPREEGGSFATREWIGAFADFRRSDGRLIPHQARVGWVLDGGYCEVWRGEIMRWSVSAGD